MTKSAFPSSVILGLCAEDLLHPLQILGTSPSMTKEEYEKEPSRRLFSYAV
ncbi:hypothetical protein ACCS91_10575 [Rhizobium ruizarguesonis]|uniref:hypothetical protein n=1 Tax=Rhizobium ruizarguesonis TaxID=2081791 RepID=UPI0013B5DEF6|nr:hypothetical protein [Rhizobium ruizarguesonis]NEH26351.1 hypothetical protein [Rhizobium ruizarguesonis]NEJ05157.1 hypothetical protein [Rhizobium ruizarguesonis]NEK06417.1 hypothetical protein [Rhizobium ruizarguesonis]QIJ41035.1 hypothetical protein G7039_13240 [Rhizobium leguminosarum]